MPLNTCSFHKKLARAFNKASVTVTVYRKSFDESTHKDTDLLVAEITGHFYKPRKRHIPTSFNDAGLTAGRFMDKFITIQDENSSLIKAWDFFTHDGVTYQITELGGYFDIYYDFSLERIMF